MFGSNELAAVPAWIESKIPFKGPSSTVEKSTVEKGIPEGQRNSTLTSYAGGMRQQNVSRQQAEEHLLRMNVDKCNPPLLDAEVMKIIDSVWRYEPSSPALIEMTMNDAGNADRFVQSVQSDIRYVRELETFIRCDNQVWKKLAIGDAMEVAKGVMREILLEADLQADQAQQRALRGHASSSLNQSRLRAACELAKWDSRLRVDFAKLDAKSMLLGVKNGVIDLKLGKLREYRSADFITRASCVEFDPDAKCPTFIRFLRGVTGGDKEYAAYLRRVMGYLLTGITREQKFFFLFGTGANGKSTFLSVIRLLLGESLVCALPPDTLMFKPRGRSSTNDLARLEGVRVVVSNEIEEGTQFDETLIKALTGGDVISARFLYKEFVDFVPRFKLLIAGNHQPIIKGDDLGIWRRVEMLPFTVTVPETKRDPKLLGKLKKELPGILAFAVRGCLAWQKQGLGTAAVVEAAVADYREEMDLLGKWLADKADVKRDLTWAGGEAYTSYVDWCKSNGLHPMSNAVFGRKLKSRFKSKRMRKGVIYLGLSSKST